MYRYKVTKVERVTSCYTVDAPSHKAFEAMPLPIAAGHPFKQLVDVMPIGYSWGLVDSEDATPVHFALDEAGKVLPEK